MSDLFKKLNTLLKASIHDALSGESREQTDVPRTRRVDPARLGSQVDREVENLRGKINDAIAYEQTLKTRAEAVQDEIARLDQEADDAVAAGNPDLARHLIERMKRSEQRLAMTQADLREHRYVTQELIERVNVLESYVAEAKRAQSERQAEGAVDEVPAEVVSTMQRLSDVLRSARETIAGMSGSESELSSQAAPPPVERRPEKSSDVDDDLEKRLRRLSKP